MKRSLSRVTLALREPWRGQVTQELALATVEDETGLVGHGDAPVGYEPAAYEIAGRDLAARRAGERLAEPLAESVAVNLAVVAASPKACAAAAAEGFERGFRAFKLKVGLDGDPERAAATREAIGPASELRLDANGAWDADDASARIADLDPFAPSYVEQPCPSLAEMARVETGVPLAADENIATADDVRLAAELGAASVVVIKLARAGGFGPAREAIRAARDVGLMPVVASLLDGPWGVAAALQLAAAEGIEDACGLATLGAFHGELGDLLPVESGRMAVPGGPGLGVEPGPLPALE